MEKTRGHEGKEISSWSKLYGRQISDPEYQEICHNLTSFFQALHEWDKEHKRCSQSNKNT